METENKITYFAKTNFRDQEKVFGIKQDDRRRHVYVIGKTGMGKTNLLCNMVIQDIQNGHGVAFVDPHGDVAENLLNFIPKDRINDVVYFNPADQDHPIAFNILEAVEGLEKKHLVASGLMGVFKKLWPDVWSARMEYILNNAILALIEYPGSTMLGINKMFSDKEFRKKVVDNVSDPMVKSFWINEFAKYTDRLATEATASIQNKVGQFLSSSIIRNIIGQTKSTINARDIMDNRKILIVNLSKGKIGEDNMNLLGGMIITKLQMAAMERVDMPEHERKDFYLYVDELQNFVNESFAGILSEARKYHLNLILTHQYINQLPDVIRDAVFGNVGTLITFRVGAEDAEFLEKEFEPMITMNDIINLPKYNVYLKLMIDGIASNAFSALALPPMEQQEKSHFDTIIRVSREKYSCLREDIEEKISRWSGVFDEEETPENSDRELFKTKCAECGKETYVPFKPDDRRPVYCEKCLKEARSSGKVFSFKRKPDGNPSDNRENKEDSKVSLKDAFSKVFQERKNESVQTKSQGKKVDTNEVKNMIRRVMEDRAKKETQHDKNNQANH